VEKKTRFNKEKSQNHLQRIRRRVKKKFGQELEELKTEYGIENIYYQDESGFDEYYTRRYGYSTKGDKIYTKISGKKYQRQSITALLNDKNEIVEHMIYEDTANTELMLVYFQEVLAKLPNKSVIIMDNASFHRGKKLEELFEKYNHRLVFLPAYSPELNPIENMWGTIKQNLRSYYDYSKTLFENLSFWVCEYSM
jgi:transposase